MFALLLSIRFGVGVLTRICGNNSAACAFVWLGVLDGVWIPPTAGCVCAWLLHAMTLYLQAYTTYYSSDIYG